MNPVSPKVTAGAGGAGLGSALLIVLLWAFHLQPPPEVVAAMTALIGGASGFAMAYATPHVSAAMQAAENGQPSSTPAPVPPGSATGAPSEPSDEAKALAARASS